MTTHLEQYLTQYCGSEVVYFPNPGNAGDSVIATATYQIFDKIGLSYETPKFGGCDLHDRIVIYGGGGNLVGQSTYSARVAKDACKLAKRLVILPHTIKSVTPIIEDFGRNVDVICREPVSYNYVKKISSLANVYLMDDVAFSLDVRNVLEDEIILSRLERFVSYAINKTFTHIATPSFDNVIRSILVDRNFKKLQFSFGTGEVYCFRTDPEKTSLEIPEENIDISAFFQFGVETKDVAYLSARAVLSFLANFKTVHTNRLHIAISAALLGLEVKFYANNYYKCRAVYNFSMEGRFPNVHWMG
ncbi:polysaccharide pyruvyl transferase family protein [Thiocystis violascens]|uniref:Exopolysaccharide biosynthesis protein n=1 Tax=Thiocystis violascens (strain ATCC 17096 / DSM 198 / 6111) TaxID=765911 RepID=I3YFW3_THIV6|nr:polysaccharide pyruvyl transferase family protein [Thiocystis violascens]AFL75881.1 exopolysaccharide biosynthesis protein [Thiocystis violascens DSM 198]